MTTLYLNAILGSLVSIDLFLLLCGVNKKYFHLLSLISLLAICNQGTIKIVFIGWLAHTLYAGNKEQ